MRLGFQNLMNPYAVLLIIAIFLSFSFYLHLFSEGIDQKLIHNDSEDFGDWVVVQFCCTPVILIVIGMLWFLFVDNLDEKERVRKGKRKNKKRKQKNIKSEIEWE
jgi:hypothetical protein|tara:strand:- start:319 stop:633 length:315 start_codon:yes stop_codon:yes gene_type:complete